jgi:primase-polymerase (primpol)-like protein
LQTNGKPAKSTASETWCDYQTAKQSTVGNGLGFVLSNADDVYCIDLDDCLTNGKPNALAQRILDRCGHTYVEVSPSGRGLHVFLRGDAQTTIDHEAGIEVYTGKRFLCMTGKTLTPCQTIAKIDLVDVLA